MASRSTLELRQQVGQLLIMGCGGTTMSARLRSMLGTLQPGGIILFQRNVQEFPQSSNAYDSLAEAYMKAGQKDLAIANYEKSLQLDPKNQNAVEMLKKLNEKK